MQAIIKSLTSLLIKSYQPKASLVVSKQSPQLRELVDRYSFVRHHTLNPVENRKIRRILSNDFIQFCDSVQILPCGSIVAEWGLYNTKKITITGHYDGPPDSAGADDNASALATMVHLAKKLSPHKPKGVRFIAFDREEEHLAGSREFCDGYDLSLIDHVVNLEMVGYFDSEPNTQRMPEGFPRFNVGDFLAIVGNRNSGKIIKNLMKLSKRTGNALPLKGIKVPFGLETKLPHLSHVLRSDHASFWAKGIPAVMLTDTSEFRNPHYHEVSDIPYTLNYDAMAALNDLLFDYVI